MPGPLSITRSTEVVPERQQPDCGHTMVLTYHRHPDPHLYHAVLTYYQLSNTARDGSPPERSAGA